QPRLLPQRLLSFNAQEVPARASAGCCAVERTARSSTAVINEPSIDQRSHRGLDNLDRRARAGSAPFDRDRREPLATTAPVLQLGNVLAAGRQCRTRSSTSAGITSPNRSSLTRPRACRATSSRNASSTRSSNSSRTSCGHSAYGTTSILRSASSTCSPRSSPWGSRDGDRWGEVMGHLVIGAPHCGTVRGYGGGVAERAQQRQRHGCRWSGGRLRECLSMLPRGLGGWGPYTQLEANPSIVR